MSKEVKVKILDMTYDQDNNLFQMHIEELVGDHKKVALAVSGNDFGITKDMPIEFAQTFCKEMKGKEKNLHIERDNTGISKDSVKKMPVETLHESLENVISYPIDEVMNSIYPESKEKGNED